MTRLEWKVSKYFIFKGKKMPLGEDVPRNPIRQYSPFIKKAMPLIKPLAYLHNYFFTSGFVYRTIGRWIQENVNKNSTFLDIGCGDLALRRQLPKHVIYNAFDVSFSEYILDLALKLESVNIAIASATKIPLDANKASILTATEVLEHIPAIDTVLNEIHRVARPDALFLVSIPNNYCYKYHVKGQHEDHHHKWMFDEFVRYLESHRLKFVKGCKKGWWIPLPSYLTGKASYHLPITSEYEYYNTNFFFVFRVLK